MDTIDYLEHQVKTKLGGDNGKIEELFSNEDVFSELVSRGKNSDWYHYEVKTFDGWYLVKTEGRYQAYYQERGGKNYIQIFSNLKEAAKYFYEYSRYFHS